jgi:hypothetical protein
VTTYKFNVYENSVRHSNTCLVGTIYFVMYIS